MNASEPAKQTETILDVTAIMDILPHRYPFILVDRIIELTPMERVLGLKNVTINEPFFVGHFPGHPVMPGVLILEALAQAGGLMLSGSENDPAGKLVYFTGIDNVKFRRPVVPGDQLKLAVEMVKFRRNFCKMHGKALVNDELACEGDLSAALVEK